MGAKKADKDISIEEGFDKLADILDKMDTEGISLEASFEMYNEGLAVVKTLNEKLESVENRLTVINGAEEE